MAAKTKFILGSLATVVALAWLGFVGFRESKAYYLTLVEFRAMQKELEGKTVKIAGEVLAGSIDRSKSQIEFTIGEGTVSLRVRYVGKAVIPDTFKEGSKALVEGTLGQDGVFIARHIEAKCASKYEAEYEKKSRI